MFSPFCRISDSKIDCVRGTLKPVAAAGAQQSQSIQRQRSRACFDCCVSFASPGPLVPSLWNILPWPRWHQGRPTGFRGV